MRSFLPVPGMRAPALAFIAMSMVWAAFAAQVPVLKAQIGATDAVFGAVFVVSSLGAIGSMWIAPLVDRSLGAWSVAACSAAMALGFLVAVQAGSVWVFGLAMICIAAASGLCDILMNTRVSELEARDGRALMSLNHALYSFGYAGVALVTGFAREAGWGPKEIYAVVSGLILVMCLMMRAPHSHVAGEGVGIQLARPGGLVWLGGLIVLAALFAESAGEGWSALLIERELGGGAADGALGPALLGLMMGVGRLFGHVLSRRFADTRLIGLACLTASAGAVSAALAYTPLMAQAGFALMGFGVSLVVPLAMGIVGRSVAPTGRVRALARVSAIGYGAFMIGPAVLGGVAQAVSLSASFMLVGAVLFSVGLLLVPALARTVASGGAARP
ncbi:MAG: MFS transporter [Rhodobacteraceae bacterium]|nr:MAG: MFS transporter [Paracoccaceae bacterium]